MIQSCKTKKLGIKKKEEIPVINCLPLLYIQNVDFKEFSIIYIRDKLTNKKIVKILLFPCNPK